MEYILCEWNTILSHFRFSSAHLPCTLVMKFTPDVPLNIGAGLGNQDIMVIHFTSRCCLVNGQTQLDKHHCFYESNVFSVVGMWTHSNVNYKTKQKQNSAVLIKENKTQDIKHQLGCLHPSLTLNGGVREGGRDCIVLAALILRCPSEPRSILSMAWWFIFLREAKGGPVEAIMSSSIHNVDSRDESRISSWWLLLLESLS